MLRKKLEKMAKDPESTLREIDQLVEQRGEKAYYRLAELLAELRTAD